MGTEKKITIRRSDGRTITGSDGKEYQQIQVAEANFWDWVLAHGKHTFSVEPVASDRAYLIFDDENPKYIVEGAIESLEDLNPLRSRKSDSMAMEEITPEVEVIRVTEIGKIQGEPLFRVDTRMYVPAHKYSTEIYLVKLLEPIALADEYHMDHGEFSFDTLENVQEKQRFKIAVIPVT